MRTYRTRRAALLIGVLALPCAARAAAATDLEPPRVAIAFPPPASLTDATHVVVNGTARDASGVAGVWVAGYPAVSSDGFRTWSVDVPLSDGPNVLTASAVDALGNADPAAAVASIERDPAFLRLPYDLAQGALPGRVQVLDLQEPMRLIEADLVSGIALLVSSDQRGRGPRFAVPRSVVLDAGHGRSLVTDEGLDAVLAVDLASGDRTVFSAQGVGLGPALDRPMGIALDAAAGRALVIEDGAVKMLLAIDLASGDRTVLSDATTGSGPPFVGPQFVALDAANGRALTTSWAADEVLGVDLASGDRTVLASATVGAGTKLDNPWALAVATGGGQAWVVQSGIDPVLALDLATGDRRSIFQMSAHTGLLEGLRGALLDEPAQRLRVCDNRRRAVLGVGLATGVPGVEFRSGRGAGPVLGAMADMSLDPTDPGTAWVLDGALRAVARVDLASGERVVVSDRFHGEGPPLGLPQQLAFDAGAHGPRVLVAGSNPNAVVAVDPESGERSVLSASNVGLGPGFTFPSGIVIDAPNERALVLDAGALLIAVDLASGDRTLLPAAGGGPPMFYFSDLALDAARNRVLVGDLLGEIHAIDLASGVRTVLSSATVGAGPKLKGPVSLTYDPQGERLVVQDLERLVLVDGATGDRTLLLDVSEDQGPSAQGYVSPQLWPAPGGGAPRVLFAGAYVGAASLARDPATGAASGDRVLLSR